MVDYQVLLRLSFSPQLKSNFEKVKMELEAELHRASQDGNSCEENQCELRLGQGGDRVTAASLVYPSSVREPLGSQGASPEVLVTG